MRKRVLRCRQDLATAGRSASSLPPGGTPPTLRFWQINAGGVDVRRAHSAADLGRCPPGTRWWLDLIGLGDPTLANEVTQLLQLDPLSASVLLDAHPRAGLEHRQSHSSIVLHLLTASGTHVEAQPLFILFNADIVITATDQPHPVLDVVRKRLQQGTETLRSAETDHFVHAVLDAVVDDYFTELDALDDALDEMEDEIFDGRPIDPLRLSANARQDLQTIRHAIGPMQRMVSALRRDQVDRVSEPVRRKLRDCHDHLVLLQTMIEASREVAASLVDSHVSRIGQKTNEVMRVLAVVSTLFLPLTFITGVYGMNFDPRLSPMNMPELHWRWGYPFALALMVASAVVTLLVCWKMGFFLGDRRRKQER